ncbi:MAG: NUDIX hydrolase [Verrucomicrobiota bacterium]
MMSAFETASSAQGQGWLRLEQQTEFCNPHLQIDAMTYSSPGRDRVSWTVARRKSAVVLAPLTVDGRYLMVEQERPAIERSLWEFPAGQIEAPVREIDQKCVEETAFRELEEECGYGLSPASSIRHFGFFYSSPGFTDECAYLLEVSDVVPLESGSQPEESECITGIRAFSLEEIEAKIVHNELVDANSLSLVARLLALQNYSNRSVTAP